MGQEAGPMHETPFQRLKRVQEETEGWLGRHFPEPLRDPDEAALARSLARYIRHCRRDAKKWSDEGHAGRAIDKIRRAVLHLTLLRYAGDE